MFGVRNDNSKPGEAARKENGIKKMEDAIYGATSVPLFQIVASFTFADFTSFRGGSLRPSCRYNSNGLFHRVRNKLRAQTANTQKVIRFGFSCKIETNMLPGHTVPPLAQNLT